MKFKIGDYIRWISKAHDVEIKRKGKIMAKSESEIKINTDKIEVKIKKTILNHKYNIKEKIAFALFIMHYYKHEFSFIQDEYLIKLKLKEIKNYWEVGKLKNKVKNFLSLADEIFDIEFNNNKIKKDIQ